MTPPFPERWNGARLFLMVFMVVMMILCWIGTGCVSVKRHKLEVDAAFKSGQAQHCGLIEDSLNATSAENAAMQERLRKFNQVDRKGRLRPAKQKQEPCPDDQWHTLVNGQCVDLLGK